MVYQIPPFLMGQAANVDFSPIQNALAQWRQDQRFNAQNALARDKMAEDSRQFNASNALSREHLGIAQRSAARADELAPLQLKQLEVQIQQMRQQGATEAQLAPLKIQHMQAQTELARAQAKAAGTKDAFQELILKGFAGQPNDGQQPNPLAPPTAAPPRPAQPGPTLQPQSFQGGVTTTDPLFVQTQAAENEPAAAPRPAPAADLVDVPGFGKMSREKARAMAMAAAASGKGDLGKLIMDEVDKDKLVKEARNKVDEQEMNAVNGLGRLKQIASGYQDKWLTYENKLKQYGLSWADSFETMRSKMKPEDVKDLAEYTAFKRDAFEHLTQGIKDATGAAMGVQEEKRIRAGMPDPASDSPTQFKAKLMGSMRAYELSIQRTQFLRQNGFKGDANAAATRMPLERFQGLLNDSRGLYKQLKDANPNADDEAIKDQVRRQIIRKYGIAT